MKTRPTWDWQYVVICGGYVGKNPVAMITGLLQGGIICRNYTSSGKCWWALDRAFRRINIWPISIWY